MGAQGGRYSGGGRYSEYRADDRASWDSQYARIQKQAQMERMLNNDPRFRAGTASAQQIHLEDTLKQAGIGLDLRGMDLLRAIETSIPNRMQQWAFIESIAKVMPDRFAGLPSEVNNRLGQGIADYQSAMSKEDWSIPLTMLGMMAPAAMGVIGAAGTGAAGTATTAGMGAEAGGALYSTPAATNASMFGPATASTPALTTYAGPTGTSLLSSQAPSMMGIGAAGAGMGLAEMSVGPEVGNYTAPQVETGTWPTGDAYTPPQDVSPVNTSPQPPNFGMRQDFGAPVQGSQSPISNVGGPVGQEPIVSNFGSTMGDQMRAWAPTVKNAANLGQTALSIGGGIQSLAAAEDMEDQLHAQMQAAQQAQQPTYPYQMNWELVDQYLRDPMAILRNNPGYLASVDFVEKEGRRRMAKEGYNVSGNSTYYLADVLGKNAAKWHEQTWAPIRDAAGLMTPSDPSRLAQVQVNAQSQINRAKQQGLQGLYTGGTLALKTLPDIFRSWNA